MKLVACALRQILPGWLCSTSGNTWAVLPAWAWWWWPQLHIGFPNLNNKPHIRCSCRSFHTFAMAVTAGEYWLAVVPACGQVYVRCQPAQQLQAASAAYSCHRPACCTPISYALAAGDICKIILAVLLPPLGVFAEKEKCDKDLLINILL